MLNIIKQIDFFRKIQQDVASQQTSSGGFISCLMIFLLLILISNSVYELIQGDLLKYPYVENGNAEERIRVNINITFMSSPCQALSVDYQDVTGTHLEDIQHTLYKFRLTPEGEYKYKEEMFEIKKFENKNMFPSFPKIFGKEESLNDCYGAEIFKGQKCESCNDVMVAYAQRGWPLPPLEAIAQCKPGIFHHQETEEEKQKQEQRQKMLEEHRQEQERFNILKQQEQQQQEIENQRRLQFEQQQKQQEQYQQQLQQQQQQEEQQRLLREQEEQNRINQQTQQQQQQANIQIELQQEKEKLTIKELTVFQQEHLKQKIAELKELSFNAPGFDPQRLLEDKIYVIDDLLAMINGVIKDQQEKQLGINITHQVVYLQNIEQQQRQTVSEVRIFKKSPNNLVDNFEIDFNFKQSNSQIQVNKLIEIKDLKIESEQQIFDFSIEILQQNNNYKLIIARLGVMVDLNQDFELLDLNFIIKPENSQLDQFGQISIMIFPQIQSNAQVDSNQQQQESEKKPENNMRQRRRMLFADDYGQEPHGMHSISIEDINKLQEQIGEGCQIYGHMYLKKVPGNFHISYHNKGLAKVFIHQQFSLRHQINLLEFTTETGNITQGKYVKGTNPLDKKFFDVPDGTDMDYYIKIVSTRYENIFEDILNFYQFTALSTQKVLNPDVAAVTFKYEFDPVSMKYISKHGNLVEFIVSLCAIVGGVVSLSRFFHSVFV